MIIKGEKLNLVKKNVNEEKLRKYISNQCQNHNEKEIYFDMDQKELFTTPQSNSCYHCSKLLDQRKED
jgi:hypothetical protein